MILVKTFLTVCVLVVSINAQDDDDGMSLELGQRDANDEGGDESEEVIVPNPNSDASRTGASDGSRISFVREEGGFYNNTADKKEALGNWSQPKYIPTGWAEAKSKVNPGPPNSTSTKQPTVASSTRVLRTRNITTSRNVFALDDDDDDEPPSRPPPEVLAKRITANEDIIMGASAVFADSVLLFGALCLRHFMS